MCEGVLHAALTAGRRGRLGLKAWFEAPPWVEGSGVGQGELGVDPLGSRLHLHHCPLYIHLSLLLIYCVNGNWGDLITLPCARFPDFSKKVLLQDFEYNSNLYMTSDKI